MTMSGGGNSLIFPIPLVQGGFQDYPFAFADLDGGQTGHALNLAAAQAMRSGFATADEIGGQGTDLIPEFGRSGSS